jgi:hypothetical protein
MVLGFSASCIAAMRRIFVVYVLDSDVYHDNATLCELLICSRITPDWSREGDTTTWAKFPDII